MKILAHRTAGTPQRLKAAAVRTMPGVRHHDIRQIYSRTDLIDFPGQIRILKIEEISFVKSTDLLKQTGADAHKAAGGKLDGRGLG